jgi:hypothetical protein
MARLSKRQRKEIINPVVLTVAERTRIKNHNYDWSYYYLNDIISKIRIHYANEQGNLCAFCKLPFRDEIQVEHMIPKAGAKNPRKDFSYTPKNLCVSCRFCNTNKSTHNDFIGQIGKHYPTSGFYFKIIHPHFDPYFDHILIVDKSRYVAKTLKGYRTIQRIGLFETKITDLLVNYMRYEDDPIIQAVLSIRDLPRNSREVIDRFINRILG